MIAQLAQFLTASAEFERAQHALPRGQWSAVRDQRRAGAASAGRDAEVHAGIHAN
jgi:hypothetical protein